MTPEMINAIAGLWKLVAAIAVLFALFIFRKPLEGRLNKLSRFKAKNAEVEFTDTNKVEIKEPETASPPPKLIEESDDRKLPGKTHPENEDGGNPVGKMIQAFHDRNPEDAKKYFDLMQADEIDKTERLRNELFYHYLSYIHLNQANAITELKRLSEIDIIKADALFWLAGCYKHSRSYGLAIDTVKASIDVSPTEEYKAYRIQALAELLIETETSINEVIQLILNSLKEIKVEQNQYPLFITLAKIFEKTGDELSRSIVLDKALELKPEDTDLRFSAAYAQSNAELPYVSLLNYDTLIRQEPENSTAINNLGVGVDSLNMPIRAAKHFKDSAKKNNTLAMANLAYRYIEKGLADEAQEILKNAQKLEDVHPNIASATSSLEEQKAKENKIWENAIQIGIKQKSFIKKYIEARFTVGDKTGAFGKQWKYKNEIIKLEEKDGKFISFWGSGPNRRRLTGEINGRSAKINLQKQSAWITDKESFDSGTPGLFYINSEETQARLIILEKDKPEFIEFELHLPEYEPPLSGDS